jgi:hypothetical protein
MLLGSRFPQHRIEPYALVADSFFRRGRSAGIINWMFAAEKLAMTAFLSRLFRRPRVDAPAWIEVGELQRRLAAGDALVLVEYVNPRSSLRLRAICPVPSTCRWPIYQAGPGNLPPGENRSCLFARPIGDLTEQRQSCLPPAYRMSPSFVAEHTGGTDKV